MGKSCFCNHRVRKQAKQSIVYSYWSFWAFEYVPSNSTSLTIESNLYGGSIDPGRGMDYEQKENYSKREIIWWECNHLFRLVEVTYRGLGQWLSSVNVVMTSNVTKGNHLGTHKFYINSIKKFKLYFEGNEETVMNLNRKVVRSNLYFRISVAAGERLIFVQLKFL